MRKVFIDLSPDNHLQKIQVFGGYSEEHNETLLQIKLPTRMLLNDFLYYYFKFETAEGEKILSIPIPSAQISNSIVETPLWQQLTKKGTLKVNVVASNGLINELPTQVAMTNTVVLTIERSPNGQDVIIDPNGIELQLLQLIDERVIRDLQNLEELVIDQSYNPTSKNAQSGAAVASAIGNYVAYDDEIEFILDGGDSSEDGEINANVIIDGAMSDTSNNAVANKVIKAYIDKLAVSYITEQGVIDGWRYRKWSNGDAECWREYTQDVETNNVWTEFLYYGEINTINFPENLFISRPVLDVTAEEFEGGNAFFTKKYTTIENTGQIFIISPNNYKIGVRLNLMAKGRWM